MRVPLTCLLTVLSVPALADSGFSKTSSARVVPLIELYTSEGCSSCPPADEWFTDLRAMEGLWEDWIPVAFHVDYWDDLGWKDPFAKAAFTQRQRAYGSLWRSRTIYTPGLVWQGREWRGWRGGLAERPADEVGVLSLSRSGGSKAWQLQWQSNKQETLNFHLVLLGMDEVSEVTRGENAGRRLVHDFVVLAHTTSKGEANRAAMVLDHPRAKAVVAWVSRDGDPTPIQSVGDWWKR